MGYQGVLRSLKVPYLHNNPNNSKSGSPQGLVGSNPTASAKEGTVVFQRFPPFLLTLSIIWLSMDTTSRAAGCSGHWKITNPRVFMRSIRASSLTPSRSREIMKSSPISRQRGRIKPQSRKQCGYKVEQNAMCTMG